MRILPCPLAALSCLLLVVCSKNSSHKFVLISTLPEQSGLSQPSRGSLLGQVAALCRPTRKAFVLNSLERCSGHLDISWDGHCLRRSLHGQRHRSESSSMLPLTLGRCHTPQGVTFVPSACGHGGRILKSNWWRSLGGEGELLHLQRGYLFGLELHEVRMLRRQYPDLSIFC